MKKNRKKIYSITVTLLCSLFFVSIFSVVSIDAFAYGTNAFIQYGTMDYAVSDPDLMGGAPELSRSSSIATSIYNRVSYAGYDYYKDYWGNRNRQTQPYTVWDEARICENNYDSTVVYYKGHSWEGRCPYYSTGCTYQHYGVYDCEGYTSSPDQPIRDFEIHNYIHDQGDGTHDLVYLWTCGSANSLVLGSAIGSHSWGMCASWLDIPYGTSLSMNGYLTPDYSGRCFIGFYNISRWYITSTGYSTYDHGDFAYSFFDYAMIPGWSIHMALDAATDDTHTVSLFSQCDLYALRGYYITDPRDPPNQVWSCMMIIGDGNLVLRS